MDLNKTLKWGFTGHDIFFLILTIITIVVVLYIGSVSLEAKQVCLETCRNCTSLPLIIKPLVP